MIEKTISSLYGQEGLAWLAGLPKVLEDLSRRHGYQLGQELDYMSYNYIIGGQFQEKEIVLKASFSGPELLREMEALRAWGDPYARVLAYHPEEQVMVLERIMPGHMLQTYEGEEEQVQIFLGLLQELYQKEKTGPAPPIRKWFSKIYQEREDFEAAYHHLQEVIEEGLRSFEELDSQPDKLLLHGDLHHENILQGEGGRWQLIDPKGVIGHPIFEVGPFIRNYLPRHKSVKESVEQRIYTLARELPYGVKDLARAALSMNVLSAYWSFEDGFTISEEMESLLKVLYNLIKTS